MKKSVFTFLVGMFMIICIPISAQISLTSPVGGEVWQSGSSYNITWTCTGCGPTVDIELSTDGGLSWGPIQMGAPNTGSYSWSIPTMFTGVSAACRVRVTSGMFVDISMQNFQISHPSMTVITPNGGETFIVDQNVTISVSSTNSFGGTLHYSTDFGNTWNFIVNLSSGFPGTVNYTWTVPNHNAFNSCLIRFNSGGPFADFSDSYFTIRNDIDVTSPNGSEFWLIGSSQTITWTNTSGVSNVTILYSTDNGSSWGTVAAMAPTTPTGGSYVWNPVPPPASSQCLVVVMDFMFALVRDTSDAVFTISSGTATVTAPNGGETWYVGSTQNITWTYTGLTSLYDIEYSTNNGSTWNSVATGVSVGSFGGSYAWTIPNTPSNQCLVRVTDMFDPSRTDVSNAVFTISSGTATVTAPNGGEMWYVGSMENITWTYTGPSSNYDIEYSSDNGATWNLVANGVADNGMGGGSFGWVIPNTPSTQCLVRVTDMADPTRTDVSNAVFTIASPSITVTVPNGGENWLVGSAQNITWTTVGPISSVDIELSTDNGSSWTILINNHPNGVGGGSYAWTVTNTPSTQCLVRVKDFMNPSIIDQSDAVFTISSGTATVTAPNGGETWYVGSMENITWTYTGAPSNYDIDYSTDNGSTWNLVATGVAVGSFGGSYPWTIPNTPSTQCLVRVTDMSDPTRTDVSNAVFTIASPSITVTSPNGGENWVEGTSQVISWTSAGAISSVDIEYSTNNGSTWTNVVSNHPNGTGGGSYAWTVPNTPSNQCLVRITDFMNPSITDQSNAVFTISANLPPSLTVVAPNGGEVFVAGNTTNISWTFTGGISNIMIEYTNDNGNNWYTIVSSVPVTSSPYVWTVGNNSGNQCKVRISEVGNPSMNDLSDNFFEIQVSGISNETVSNVNIYPNPVSDLLQINREKDTETLLQIMSMEGRIVNSEIVVSPMHQVDMRNYPSGVYFIQIDGRSFKVIKK